MNAEYRLQIRPVDSGAAVPLDALTGILIDVVHGGASVGFMAPLAHDEARAYWQGVAAALGPGLKLWVAEDARGQVVGTVQLAPCLKPNGRHRAEVQKLQVHSAARGQGVGKRLMETVEAEARALGLTLLVLDTLAGSPAESIYRHLGWVEAGRIPDYAAHPTGGLEATVVFYKRLG